MEWTGWPAAFSGALSPHRGKGQAAPSRDEAHTAERCDGAEGANTGERHRVQRAGKQHGACEDQPAARVGQRTDYDKLIIEIWTDGRISPDDALTQASAILQHHLDVFVGYDKNAVEFEIEIKPQDDEKAKLKKLLNMSVNEIELSVRAANCLNNANITTVGQLAMKSEQEMLKYRNFGKKSLNEIKEKLTGLNLTLGMNIDPALLEMPAENKNP